MLCLQSSMYVWCGGKAMDAEIGETERNEDVVSKGEKECHQNSFEGASVDQIEGACERWTTLLPVSSAYILPR